MATLTETLASWNLVGHESWLLIGLAVLVLVAGLLLALLARSRRVGGHDERPAGAQLPPARDDAGAGSIQRGLTRTRLGLHKLLERGPAERGAAPLVYDRLEEALLSADVGAAITSKLVSVARRAQIVDPKDVRAALVEQVAQLLANGAQTVLAAKPQVILVVGVNGVGKTTTVGKLAATYARDGKKVLLVAADTFRAAAAEQLEIWARRAGTRIIKQQAGGDPAAAVFDGMRAAKAREFDVVLVDTAGRLHTKRNLMEELRKIRRIAEREVEGAPHEVLLVLDATTGQNGLAQAREFLSALRVTGVVVTKLDGTAKGGIVLAVKEELGIPIKYIGLGEGLEDLRPFDPEEFARALFGE